MAPKSNKGRVKQAIVVAKTGSSEAPLLASELGRWLEKRGVHVLYEQQTARSLNRDDGVRQSQIPDGVDLAVVAGGDGTLLSMARSAAPLGIPILGINLGSLGFLTELQPDERFDGLEAVLDGRFEIEERQALRVRHLRHNRPRQDYVLLNDAVITKSALARMIDIGVRVDADEVTTYTGDGLIVASPTGSTAYALSAGGPILDPRMSAFVIAPICPHSMTYRPLVVPGNVQVHVSLQTSGEAVYLTLDGQIGFPLESDDELEISSHQKPVRLVKVAGRGFFEVLRRKLRWGER